MNKNLMKLKREGYLIEYCSHGDTISLEAAKLAAYVSRAAHATSRLHTQQKYLCLLLNTIGDLYIMKVYNMLEKQ